jgi:hypothetical protein
VGTVAGVMAGPARLGTLVDTQVGAMQWRRGECIGLACLGSREEREASRAAREAFRVTSTALQTLRVYLHVLNLQSFLRELRDYVKVTCPWVWA